MEKQVINCETSEVTVVALTAEEIAARAAEEAQVGPVPRSVTRLQLIRAMRAAELKTAFDAALAAAGADTQEDWSLAVSIRRDDALVSTFAVALGLSETATDDLFRAAGAL